MNEDLVINKLIQMDEKIDALIENQETFVKKDEFYAQMDKMMVVLNRLDQERIFTQQWVTRIENDVQRVKEHLHIT